MTNDQFAQLNKRLEEGFSRPACLLEQRTNERLDRLTEGENRRIVDYLFGQRPSGGREGQWVTIL